MAVVATVCTHEERKPLNGYVYLVIQKTLVKAGDAVTIELGHHVGVWRPLK